MKYKVTGIKYDYDGDDDGLQLPTELVIEADDENNIADEISDKTGFCILSIGNIIPI